MVVIYIINMLVNDSDIYIINMLVNDSNIYN